MKCWTLLICLFFTLGANAQNKWSLEDCVAYALEHNINIKQAKVQEEVAGINAKQSRLSTLPSFSFQNNDGFQFGKTKNPSTGILENQNYLSVGLTLSGSVDIFNWFSKKNTVLANQWSQMAAKASVDKLKSDITLTVANAYLQILLAKEQQEIARIQVEQSASQLDIVKKQVKAGALPELNQVEIESQLASDSANYITASGNVDQAVLTLKTYMNLDAAADFEVQTPSIDEIPLAPIGELQPEAVYQSALENLPQTKVDLYSLEASRKSLKAAKGVLYPSISAYGGMNTNYGYFRVPVYDQIFTGYIPNGNVIPDGSGGFINVQQPQFKAGDRKGFMKAEPFGTQFSNNFGQQVGIVISVPIFNGWQAKANYKRAQWDVKNQEYQQELNNQTLKQDIYSAYTAAIVALEKFTSSKSAVDAAQKSYDFSTKRFNVGMLTTLEQITNQNNLFKAKLQYILNRYDYVFKMKILEFYKGQGVKL